MTSIVNPSKGMSAVSMSMTRRLVMFSDRLRGRAPDGATGMTAAPGARNGQDNGQDGPAPASPAYAHPAPAAAPGQHLAIEIEDWDLMFAAVRTRLMRAVGQRLDERPNMPEHSAELSASMVLQAVVLDCVTEMDKLHASLKRQRSQRLTP